jgi:hypothetical protein
MALCSKKPYNTVDRRIFMVHRLHKIAHDPKNSEPLWTQDESIDFECAKEAVGNMIAICSSLIADEKRREVQDLSRIKELNQKRSIFEDERKNLHWYEKEKIAKFRKEYGQKIKNYYEGGECPV